MDPQHHQHRRRLRAVIDQIKSDANPHDPSFCGRVDGTLGSRPPLTLGGSDRPGTKHEPKPPVARS
jgi:hypothetical protein